MSRRCVVQYYDYAFDNWIFFKEARSITKAQNIIGKQYCKRWSCSSWRIIDADTYLVISVYTRIINEDALYKDYKELYKTLVIQANKKLNRILEDVNKYWHTDCGT